MASKTISLHLEAYQRLVAARRYSSESFSQVILRARWPEDAVTARDYLVLRRRGGEALSEHDLAAIEESKGQQQPPEDKWTASSSKRPS